MNLPLPLLETPFRQSRLYVFHKSNWLPLRTISVSASRTQNGFAIICRHELQRFRNFFQLEVDTLIKRVGESVVPPHVEYSLTDCGLNLSPILVAMKDWAAKYNG